VQSGSLTKDGELGESSCVLICAFICSGELLLDVVQLNGACSTVAAADDRRRTSHTERMQLSTERLKIPRNTVGYVRLTGEIRAGTSADHDVIRCR